jgi:16S rRNA (cytosine967-C5)-methyltransferase
VLHRVAHDDAWAAPTLDAELQRASVSRADAALATQIVYGALRAVPNLEAHLARHAQRPINVDDWTRAVLIGAVYQLLHLERVPSHAVVNDAVELVRMKRGKRLAGFANAILRKVAADRPEVPEPPKSVAVASWLQDALRSSIGAERTEDLLRVGQALPSIDLRVRGDQDRDALAEAILAAQPNALVSHTALSPHGLRVSGAGDPRSLPGYEAGAFAVQEEGAQLIGLLLGAGPGERVLDACAGRGGKTAQLVEAVGGSGRVVAADLHQHRLDQISAELTRLGLDPAGLETACVDWTVGKGETGSIASWSMPPVPGSALCAVGLKFYCAPGLKMRPAWVRLSDACWRTLPRWFDPGGPSSMRCALRSMTKVRRSWRPPICPDSTFGLEVLLA